MEAPALKDLITIPAIWQRVERVEERLFEVSTSDDPFLTKIAQHLLTAGGKRFRPLLAQLAAEFGPSIDDRAIDAGAAVELIHIGSLYHDDVIDEAEVRRGAVSVNANWSNTIAILAGDFLMARASEVAADSLGQEAVKLLARTYAELVEGQTLELQLTADLTHGPDDYYRVIAGKTASLIRTSARLGAMASESPPEYIEAVSIATWELGMVFQITDDALDLVATEEDLGKPAGSDIHQGVYTLPVLYALAGPEAEQISDLLRHGTPFSNEAVAEVIRIVRGGGYVDQTLDECVERMKVATDAIVLLPDIEARTIIERMGSYLVSRVEHAAGG
jgi:heptaprenyl diphosphate synthase